MEWKHKCDIEWLCSRQGYLTASSIKKLLPVTATGRPRKVTDLDRMKVWASSLVDIREDDCWSYGAAARGHILEPYAIAELNDMLEEETFFHWDDIVVTRPGRYLAFSPDAMNIPMSHENWDDVTAIAEVKSYSHEKHLSLVFTEKDKLEERWQIAAAMALLENISHAYLVLYDPSMPDYGIVAIRYDRDDLEKEIETILQIESDWKDFVIENHSLPGDRIVSFGIRSEDDIIKEVEARQRLNP